MFQDAFIDAMCCIEAALRRERKAKIISLSIGICCGLGLGLLAQNWNNTQGQALFASLSLMALLASLALFRNLLREWHTRQTPIFQALHRPQHIVWCYFVQMQPPSNLWFGPKLLTLCLGLQNGELLQLRIPPNKQNQLQDFLLQYLPHASFGYSSSLQQHFDIEPNLLRKD